MKKLILLPALLISSLANAATPPDSEAIEFYNEVTNHYYMAGGAADARGIDNGVAGAGWMRTGRSFQVWSFQSTAPADARPVCRFYSPGANSHFYTPDATECEWLKGLEASERSLNAASGAAMKGWIYEGIAFYMQAPSGGACPRGTQAIIRAYNNGYATGEGSNHRFVDDPALAELMADRSWIVERVSFCAATKATGTSADQPPTTTDFNVAAGTWSATAKWKTGIAAKVASLPLQLTVAADGTVRGSGNGCTFAGTLATGDGFRSFFTGTVSASGCSDPAFNGGYPSLKVERYGAATLMARLKRIDGSAETSTDASLSDAATQGLTQATSLVVAYVNDYRRSQGLQAVAPDAKLTEASRQLAEFMAKTGIFDHAADGRQPWDRAVQNGYRFCVIFENIAWMSGYSTAQVASQLFEGWKASPAHNMNMLQPGVMDTGIVIARSASGAFYAVQMFGSKC